MTGPGPELEASPSQAAASPPAYFPVRVELARRYLRGHGLEIGALNLPLDVPPQAQVSQVDRMTVDDLRRHYPEMAELELSEVDVVDDGETLATIAEDTQDFIVANHFLEHTADPIGTIATHLGKLRPGGILFYAVPDKRYSFDFARPLTPLEHMVLDHEEGPERSRRDHYDEWARFVSVSDAQRADPEFAQQAEHHARQLEAADYSIHTHVWTQASFLGLLLHCRERLGDAFDIEAAVQHSLELVVILRKRGAWPEPAEPTVTIAELRGRAEDVERQLAGEKAALAAMRGSLSWRLTKPLRTLKARLKR
jgi:predicted SAM-dependent methyltransferase